MSFPVKVLIAEQCDHLRQAYATIIEQEPGLHLLDAVSSCQWLPEKADALQPDIIIMAMHMQPQEGIEACRRLEDQYPHIGKIAISMQFENYLSRELMKAGTRGFLLINALRTQVLHCIKVVHEGGIYCNSGATRPVMQKMKDTELPTAYEVEVLRRLCQQQSTGTISAQTFVSRSTVSHARAELKRKSGTVNDFGLAGWAIYNGYISLSELEGKI